MLNQFAIGWQHVLQPDVLVFIALGVMFGTVMGALPGLSTTMAIALALPLSFGMSSISAMALFMGIFTGGVAGGMVSAILIGVPGTPAAVATCFDGEPMAKKGLAAKAISACNWSALIAGLGGTLVLSFLAPLIAKYALKFGSFEYFSLGVFALTLIIILSEESLVKGLISGLIGMALTLVGTAPIDSTPRYTFGSTNLQAGIGTLPFLIGIFAMVTIFEIAHKDPRHMKRAVAKKGVEGEKVTAREMIGQTWNMVRSWVIGFFIGILPSIGSGTSNIVSYMAAKSQSKHPEEFGKGCLEGVIAPQAAACAGTGGELTVLMTLGIPGDAITAMLLGGLILHGLTPGPLMFVTNGDVVYSIFVSLAIANIFTFVLLEFGTKLFVKALSVPPNYLYPIILVLCGLGAFGDRNNLFDVWCMLGLGLIAYFLTKLHFPTTPIILGFIIGSMVETNLRRGLMQSSGSFTPFITRPLSAAFLLCAILFLLWSLYKHFKKRKVQAAASQAL